MLPYLVPLFALQCGFAHAFTIIGGQVYTPGLAIIDSPQPDTPLGGDFLQVAIDVSGDGQLSLPPYDHGFATGFYNITLFLSSYTAGKNFTISNGTATSGNASVGNILQLESGSTVKHVNWEWPDCLVGSGTGGARGDYNISIRQNFRLNGSDYYTVFDLPISVTNSIESSDDRPSCDELSNDLISVEEISTSADSISSPFANGTGVETGTSGSGSGIDSGAPMRFTFGTAGLFLTFCSAVSLLA